MPRPPRPPLSPYTTLFRSPNATLPTRTHTTDAGLDIYASEEIIVTHTHAVIIPTGIAINIPAGDRKSTRLNSSHVSISYAVFCLKKKQVVTPLPHTIKRPH